MVLVCFLHPSSLNSSSSLHMVELLHLWLIDDWWFYWPVFIEWLSFDFCFPPPATRDDWDREWWAKLLYPFLIFKKTFISSMVRGDWPIFLTLEPLPRSLIVVCFGKYCLKLSLTQPAEQLLLFMTAGTWTWGGCWFLLRGTSIPKAWVRAAVSYWPTPGRVYSIRGS